MLGLFNSEEIYNSTTKEYFTEVLSSYTSENYRSANVILYSVAICDLLFKLKYLFEIYEDTTAEKILKEVNKSIKDNSSKEKWETKLIKDVYEKTELLDYKAYIDLKNLKNHRNLAAHPSINNDYKLINISQENTASNISNTLNNILTKPPLLTKKTFNIITDVLDENKYSFLRNEKALKNYLLNSFLIQMNDTTKKELYKTFWKFCFNKPDDEKAMENIDINRKTLTILHNEIKDIKKYIIDNNLYLQVSDNKVCLQNLCIFTACFPYIWNEFNEPTKLNIEKYVNDYDLLCWFKYENFKEYTEDLYNLKYFHNYSTEAIKLTKSKFVCMGDLDKFLDFTIICFEDTPDFNGFDDADHRYNNLIRPNLDNYSKDQFLHIFDIINNNDQIYGRRAAEQSNTIIIKHAEKLYPNIYDKNKYENIIYNKQSIDNLRDTE